MINCVARWRSQLLEKKGGSEWAKRGDGDRGRDGRDGGEEEEGDAILKLKRAREDS